MDDVGALAHQHSEGARVAELLDEDGVSSIYESVEDYANGAARAGAEEDAVQRDVHAPVLTQGLRDVFAQSGVALRRWVLGEVSALARHNTRESVDESLYRHGVEVCVGD